MRVRFRNPFDFVLYHFTFIFKLLIVSLPRHHRAAPGLTSCFQTEHLQETPACAIYTFHILPWVLPRRRHLVRCRVCTQPERRAGSITTESQGPDLKYLYITLIFSSLCWFNISHIILSLIHGYNTFVVYIMNVRTTHTMNLNWTKRRKQRVCVQVSRCDARGPFRS